MYNMIYLAAYVAVTNFTEHPIQIPRPSNINVGWLLRVVYESAPIYNVIFRNITAVIFRNITAFLSINEPWESRITNMRQRTERFG